jgi:intracellular multiplication protein IcmG
MSDLNHHDEEEYHFDDSENFDFGEHDASAEEEFVGDEEVVEDTETKTWNNERPGVVSSKRPLPNKKIIMVAGVVVLLIVGYFIMPRSKTPAVTAIPTATAPREMAKANPAAAPVSMPEVPTSQNTTSPAEGDATANSPNTALDNATNGAWLNTDNSTPPTSSNTQATTAAPEEAIPAQPNAPDETNLPMQMQTLNQENQTLTLKLQQVTAQSEATAARAKNLEKVVDQLQAQVKQMTQTSPPPLQRPRSEMAAEPLSAMPRSSAESNTRLVYYVQAIIPGRAWIADSNGRIITVTEGDRVEALNSTVKNIDPINGIVTLSNGRQIEYGMVAQ